MTYVIVTHKNKIVSHPYKSFDQALDAAISRFGSNVNAWLALNLRIEQNVAF